MKVPLLLKYCLNKVFVHVSPSQTQVKYFSLFHWMTKQTHWEVNREIIIIKEWKQRNMEKKWERKRKRENMKERKREKTREKKRKKKRERNILTLYKVTYLLIFEKLYIINLLI